MSLCRWFHAPRRAGALTLLSLLMGTALAGAQPPPDSLLELGCRRSGQ